MIVVSFKHKIWYVCKLWYVSIFSKWSDKDLMFKDWIMMCVFLKGYKDEVHKCDWSFIFSCLKSIEDFNKLVITLMHDLEEFETTNTIQPKVNPLGINAIKPSLEHPFISNWWCLT